MIAAKRNLSLFSALLAVLIGLLCIPVCASAASVGATPANPWPGASVRLDISGFEPRAQGVASLTGTRAVKVRADLRGRARVTVRVPDRVSAGRHALRVRLGTRSISTALFVVGARRASSTMVALSGGQRVLLDPATGRPGTRFSLRASGFSRRSTVDVRFGDRRLASKRPNSNGELTIVGSVPRTGSGARVVRVVSGRTIVALRFVVLPALAAPPPPPPPPAPPPAPPADRTPPTVAVTAPESGRALSGASVAVVASASDNVGVSAVQFRLDGRDVGAPDTSAPYSTTWNTTTASAGSHSLTAVAGDAAGNTAESSSVAVTVDNTPPTVSITAPAAGAVSGAAVAVTASASDDSGISAVQFRLDGNALGAEDASAPYSTTWDTTPVSQGPHKLSAVARDSAANTATSSEVSVTVANTRVIAAAGDIACSTSDPDWNGGNGTPGGHCRQKATSDLIFGKGYSDVLTLGDTQYECNTAAEFNGSFDLTWGRVKGIIHPAAGNHEYYSTTRPATCPVASNYFGYFGAAAGDPSKGYYSFDIGAWHVIALNSTDANSAGCPIVSCATGSAQEQWLRADLAAHPAACTLAYWHHPLFSSKPAGVAAVTRSFWNALQDFGADVVLNGHVHNYERFNPQRPDGTADSAGIREFVVGTGGHSLESTVVIGSPPALNSAFGTQTFGVLELTLKSTGYDWRFVTAAGQTPVADSGIATCH
ncbi:MAG TPA: Ig-like domain-containing protein [Solirubrobacteraceae bacterium]